MKLSQLDFNSRTTEKKPTQGATKKTKYILAKLSQYIQILAFPKNQEYFNLKNFIQSSIEIEHILPQDLDSQAVKDFEVQGQENVIHYIYQLGNLCLLEKTLNASNQNKPFEDKKDAYKQSNFLLTQSIVGKPNIGENTAINRAVQHLTSYDTWNSQSIKERQQIIADLAFNIWYDNNEKFFNLLNNYSSEDE